LAWRGRAGVAAAAVLLVACAEDPAPGATRVCQPTEPLHGMPTTIEETVDLINSFPRPVTLPCVIESLHRPLAINAISSSISLQPADGPDDPRIFIWRDRLVMSVATIGKGAQLLELAVVGEDQRSLKAEIAFPLSDHLDYARPYDRIRDEEGDRTSCGACHRGEERATEIAFTAAFVSQVIPPDPFAAVDPEYLQEVAAACDPAIDAHRCAMFQSIFAHGDVAHRDFE
jgi:hypothetical protein